MILKNFRAVKFSKSIGIKMSVALMVSLFIVISIFSHLNVKLTEKRLMDMALAGATKSSVAIKSALEQAMISGNKDIIQLSVNTVGKEYMIEDIVILDRSGVVKWAKNSSEIGIKLDRTKLKACIVCHKTDKPLRSPLTIVFEKNSGDRILRNVTPIDNKPECYSCHSPEIKVIGKLLVDYSVKEMDGMVSDNKRLLMASAAATLFSAVLICVILFNRMVGSPLGRLFDKIEKVADGDLDAVVEVKGKDEIALLGAFFNDMVSGIKTYIQMMEKEHIDERLTLANVAEILNKSTSMKESVHLILNTLNLGFGVEKCAVFYINYDGKMESKGAVGLTDEEVDMFRNYMEVALTIDDYYLFGDPMTEKGYFEVRRVREMILNGEIFVATGCKDVVDDFLVVPLKAANIIKGAVIVSKIKGNNIGSDRVKRIFSIIASAIAPHFYIGACMDEKRLMKSGPFESFIALLREHIHRVKQYDGVLSMGIIKLKNYEGLCELYGAEKASEKIRDLGVSISGEIKKVHEAVRISEDRIAVLLPMIGRAEAIEIIEDTSAIQIEGITLEIRVVTYPDDGETAEQLICSI
jgi:HAMP domain-containing protein